MSISFLTYYILKNFGIIIRRYAEEFHQTQNVNILNEFIRDLQRRTSDNINGNDKALYGDYADNAEDQSLPPIGHALNGSHHGIYDDPEAIHYTQPLEHGQMGNVHRDSNHNYSVKNILL